MLLNFKQLSADVYYIREISQGQIKLEINDGSKIDIDIKLMIKICETLIALSKELVYILLC